MRDMHIQGAPSAAPRLIDAKQVDPKQVDTTQKEPNGVGRINQIHPRRVNGMHVQSSEVGNVKQVDMENEISGIERGMAPQLYYPHIYHGLFPYWYKKYGHPYPYGHRYGHHRGHYPWFIHRRHRFGRHHYYPWHLHRYYYRYRFQ
uniref:Uncharacterized protein n=1 Tax=Eutreptiella gymnastica TaxID=73025 RepID=A0A7S4FDL4_9EUGL